MSKVLLDVRNMSVSFGGVRAVDGLTFSVQEGEVLSVIGPNGAGEDQRFQLHHRLLPKPASGSVTFNGSDITGKRPAS